MKIEVGDIVQLKCSFYDANGNLVDPGSVAIKVVLPSGRVHEGQPVRESQGVYTYDYEVVEYGYHTVLWQGTGAYQASARDFFVAGE